MAIHNRVSRQRLTISYTLFFLFGSAFALDDNQFHRLTYKSALFAYQAFATQDFLSDRNIITHHFNALADSANKISRHEILVQRKQEIARYIESLRIRNRIYMIVKGPAMQYNKFKKGVELNFTKIFTRIESEQAVQVLQYIYDEPIGTIDIFIENIDSILFIPIKHEYANVDMNRTFIKIYGSVNKAKWVKTSSLSVDILGPQDSTRRRIYIHATNLNLYSTNGKRLAEVVF